MSCPSMSVNFLGGWRFWAGSRSPPSDEVPLSRWVPAGLVLAQWGGVRAFSFCEQEGLSKGKR